MKKQIRGFATKTRERLLDPSQLNGDPAALCWVRATSERGAFARACFNTEGATLSFHSNPPNVGFVSLGCPKATVDSERILTELRAEGYRIAPSYEDADLVIVNTCGFIDAAVDESLDAIGEALDANGRVIVTGCLGAREQVVRESHPEVLTVTGPHAYQEVMAAVHDHLTQPRDPFTSLLPPEGVKLTPHHYAYVKISEGCNHRCSFCCIIPSLRGDLQSRMIGDVMQESKGPESVAALARDLP